MMPIVQLLAYRFGAGTPFEGQVVGALERLETTRAVSVLDIVLVARDGASGEVFGVAVHGGVGGANLARLLTFRLEPTERSRATRGVPPDLLSGLGDTLAAGDAVMAMLVRHDWARPLEDAVTRLGGTGLPSSIVEHSSLSAAAPHLLDIVAGRTS